MEVKRSQFKRFQQLLDEGFSPVPATGQSVFAGMQKDNEVYYCFLADREEWAEERQSILLNAINGKSDTLEVPHIPLICVKVE